MPTSACVDRVARQATMESISAASHRRCLICGPANELGLRLKFKVRRDGSVAALFSCREAFQSYPKMLHGGVTAALLDAAMTNVLFSVGIEGVTAELTVRFLARVSLDRNAVVRASIEKASSRLYYVRAELEQGRKIMARATARFRVTNRSSRSIRRTPSPRSAG